MKTNLIRELTNSFESAAHHSAEVEYWLARELQALGFSLIATAGTADFFNSHNIPCEKVFKVNESRPNSVDLIKNGKIQLVINTPLGATSRYDEYAIGWAAMEHKVAFITTLSAAATAVKAIQKVKEGGLTVKSIQGYLKESELLRIEKQ